MERRNEWLAGAAALFVLYTALPVAAQGTEAPAGPTPVTDGPNAVLSEDNFETARSVGMGFGGRAGATGTTAVVYNPANLGLVPVYHVDSTFQYMPSENAWAFGGAVADSTSGRLAAGIATRGVLGGGDRNYDGWDGRLSIGMNLAESIGLGLSGRYLRLRSDRRTSDGQPRTEQAKGFTMDASLRITPFEGFHVAAYAYNVIRTRSSLAPLQLGGGVAYNYQDDLSLGFDLLVDMTTFRDPEVSFGLGIEYNAGDKVPLRLGYRRDQGRDRNTMSMSVGYAGERRVALELALRQDVRGGSRRESLLLLSMRYAVDVQR